MGIIGLNSKDMKRFAQLLIKANNQQLDFMLRQIEKEIEKENRRQ